MLRLRGLTTLLFVPFAVCALGTQNARAQGGPPMITDDPGTPGDGRFEINIAATLTRRPHEQSWEAPALDLNYGLGERIQLTLQTSCVVLKRSHRGPTGGLGGTEVAVKWRFLDEETDGVSLSIFPRLLFSVLQSSVRRGLADEGTRVQCPLEAARKFGPVDLDFEFGPVLSSVGRSEWIYGIVGGVPVTSSTNVMAELHGSARANLSRDELTVNLGFRHKLNQSAALIASLGHDVRSPPGDRIPLIGYCGMQLEF